MLWARYLADRKQDPVFGVWHQLAALERENFAAEAEQVIEQTNDANLKIREALQQNSPQSMVDVARIYGRVLEAIDAKWQSITKLDPGDARLENDDEEQLRQVLYGPGSPAMVENDEQAQNLYHIKENNDLRSLGQPVHRINRIPAPVPNAALGEIATRQAMAGIVESEVGKPLRPAEIFQKHGFRAGHVRAEPAHEDHARQGFAAGSKNGSKSEEGRVRGVKEPTPRL